MKRVIRYRDEPARWPWLIVGAALAGLPFLIYRLWRRFRKLEKEAVRIVAEE